MKEKEQTQQKQQDVVMVPTEYMIEGIKGAVEAMNKMIADYRKKPRYNRRNDYEITKERVNLDDHMAVLKEYDLIREKKSNHPAVVRRVIIQLGDNACRYAYMRWLKENENETAQAPTKRSATKTKTKTKKS